MMLAPVVVDLGPDVGRAALEIVLDACNDVIENGQCVPRGDSGEGTPRALAVVRPADDAVLVVRIEVRLGARDADPWIVRELQFARKDPLRERWRSVGLAIATLVGESEQRAIEAADAEPEPAPPEPVPTPPVAARATERAAPAPQPPPPEPVEEEGEANDAAEEGAEAPPEPSVPVEYAPVFVGLGILTGPGFGTGAWRVGGTLRGGWVAPGGFSLSAALGSAWRTSTETFTAAWLHFDLGVGYRFPLSDAVSLGTGVFAGVQRARFEILAAGVPRSEARWNPRLGASFDAWWRSSSGFGLWAGVEVSTVGRESLLYVTPGAEPLRAPPVDGAALLGAGWWLP